MWVQVPFLAPAGMAELVDALDSGSSEGSFMKVQVLLPAPRNRRYQKVSPVFSCGTRIVRALCERIGESRSYGTGDIAEAMISALYMISASRMKGTDIISYLYRKYIILR